MLSFDQQLSPRTDNLQQRQAAYQLSIKSKKKWMRIAGRINMGPVLNKIKQHCVLRFKVSDINFVCFLKVNIGKVQFSFTESSVAFFKKIFLGVLSFIISGAYIKIQVQGQLPQRKIVPRTTAPWMIAAQVIAPRTIAPEENCPLDDCSRIITPKIIAP